MAENEFTFKDPHRKQPVVFKTLPEDKLEVIDHQRKARPAHVEHLVESIERIGFIVPLVAVETEADGKTRYQVIDGQHRLQAAREVGIRKLPVLVVPRRLATRMMNLNVEKDLNIREKAVVSLGIYRSFLESGTSMKENDDEVEDSIDKAYYVTLDSRTKGRAVSPAAHSSRCSRSATSSCAGTSTPHTRPGRSAPRACSRRTHS